MDPLLIVGSISDGIPPECDCLHLWTEVEEADRVKGVDVVAATEIGSDFRSLEILKLDQI